MAGPLVALPAVIARALVTIGPGSARTLLGGWLGSGIVSRVGSQWVVVSSRTPSWFQQILRLAGVSVGADIIIPDDIGGLVGWLVPQLPGPELFSGGRTTMEPLNDGTVVKEWTANGISFVKLLDGRMGAFSPSKGSWKFWRPKRPIVMYSNGSSSLVTLLRADRAAERQLRKLKKAIDRRFPPRPRRSAEKPTVIVESGPGSVVKR